MARVVITPIVLANQTLNVTAGSADYVYTPADIVDKNAFVCTGKELLLVHNVGIGAATITLNAAPDKFGRTGSITAYSLAADDFVILGPFPTEVYAQTDGKVNLEGSSVDIEFAVVRVP
jgi:hypothetical protein